jgi:hypothetical protein
VSASEAGAPQPFRAHQTPERLSETSRQDAFPGSASVAFGLRPQPIPTVAFREGPHSDVFRTSIEANLKGALRVELTDSARPRAMTAICGYC